MVTQAEARVARIEEVRGGAAESDGGGREQEVVLLQEPIPVILGGVEYDIPIPSYRANRDWRKAFVEYQKALLPLQEFDPKDKSSRLANADLALIYQVDALIDLFFLAAPGLDREEIETTATEQELFVAAQEVCEVLSPLSHVSAGVAKKTGGKARRGRR